MDVFVSTLSLWVNVWLVCGADECHVLFVTINAGRGEWWLRVHVFSLAENVTAVGEVPL